jgi:transposase InsO family protein
MYGVSLSSVKRWRKRRSRSRYKRAQTDNGTEFTCRFISEGKPCPFDTALEEAGVAHKPIPPRTPWHNGKVERSHRNDQRYFYDREKFGDVEELNRKPTGHPEWSNNKTMRTPGRKSPAERLAAIQGGV